MFRTTHVPMTLKDVRVRAINGDDERRALDLSFVVDPFTAALASELGSEVRRHLFTLDTAAVHGEVADVTFRLPFIGAQRISFGPADLDKPFVLAECIISKIHVRRATEDTEYTLTFVASFERPTRAELEYLVQGMARQHFITMEEVEPELPLATT